MVNEQNPIIMKQQRITSASCEESLVIETESVFEIFNLQYLWTFLNLLPPKGYMMFCGAWADGSDLRPYRLQGTKVASIGRSANNTYIVTLNQPLERTLIETDIDGYPITPLTPPWKYRVDNLRVGGEVKEETVEVVYPDMNTTGYWQDAAFNKVFGKLSENEKRRYRIEIAKKEYEEVSKLLIANTQSENIAYQSKLNSLVKELNKSTNEASKASIENEIEELKDLYENTLKKYAKEARDAELSYTSAIKTAETLYNKDKAKGQRDTGINLSDIIYAKNISVPFTNSAGVLMEATQERSLTRLEFAYNSESFDFDAIHKYRNKINDSDVMIVGRHFKRAQVMIQDITAEFKRAPKQWGQATNWWDANWEYWQINVSLLIDNKTFVQEFSNIGRHVIEHHDYYWNGDAGEKREYVDKWWRLGGWGEEVISDLERKKREADGRITQTTTIAELDPYFERSDAVESVPSIGSIERGETYESDDEQNNCVIGYEFKEPETGKISFTKGRQIRRRTELSPIYNYQGRYYTKSRLYWLGISEDEASELDEPMYLSLDGEKLSPFNTDGRQTPVYNRGSIKEPIDFHEIGFPEVA